MGVPGVSVPSFGDSFFITVRRVIGRNFVVVSVPSFGDSFFICGNGECSLECDGGFRPLIRGFFFYVSAVNHFTLTSEDGFRPLIRGFFFYKKRRTLT